MTIRGVNRWVMVGVLVSVAGCGRPESLQEAILSTSDAAEALEKVLKNPDELSATILFTASRAAFQRKRLEESAFLLYAGQLRANFDRECFPPKGQGGNSPFVLYAALSQDCGRDINPAVMADPAAFAAALERLRKWSPKAPPTYNPGYAFTARKSEADASQAVEASRTEFLSKMSDLSTLLGDAEYAAAFRTVQAHNRLGNGARPSKEDRDQAVETMKRIETEKGIAGLSGT